MGYECYVELKPDAYIGEYEEIVRFSKVINLPFMPSKGLRLVFQTGLTKLEHEYETTIERFEWVVNGYFRLYCGKLFFDDEIGDSNAFDQMFAHYDRPTWALVECDHEGECECELYVEATKLIAFLEADGWSVASRFTMKPYVPEQEEEPTPIDTTPD